MTTLNSLPPELLTAIFRNSEKEDLVALCRVSKYFFDIAQPLLYRRLSFYFDILDATVERYRVQGDVDFIPDEDVEYIKQLHDEQEEKQNLIFIALENTADRCRWVHDVTVDFSTSTEAVMHRFSALLRQMQNLQILVLKSDTDFSSIPPFWEAVPSTIEVLDTYDVSMPVKDYLDICCNFAFLKKLYVGWDTTVGEFPIDSVRAHPKLPLLESLSLHYNFHSKSFFMALTSSTNSLRHLDLNFVSVPAIDITRLANLRSLFLSGAGTPSEVVDGAGMLDALPQLKSLTIDVDSRSWPSRGRNAAVKLLQHLPSRLVHLSLQAFRLSAAQIVDVVLLATPSLKLLETSCIVKEWSNVRSVEDTHDEDAEDDFEELCRERGISLKWFGGRQSRDD